MSVREKGRKKIKQETSTQYKVTDPISMADLEHIYTLKKGKIISQQTLTPEYKNLAGG